MLGRSRRLARSGGCITARWSSCWVTAEMDLYHLPPSSPPLSPLGHRRLAGSVITLEYTFLEYTNHASKSRIGASANYLSSHKCCKFAENMGEWSQAHTRDRWKFSHDAQKYVHFDTVQSENRPLMFLTSQK